MDKRLLDGDNDEEVLQPWTTEILDIFKLALPIFVSRLSWVGMKVTDTALLGHTGTRYLSASALSDLWTSSTGVFIQGRVLGMFVAQAFGANNKKLAGIWLQVSLVCLSFISIPVIACWAVTYLVLHGLFKQSQQISTDAAYYALILMSCIPARVLFSQISQYLSSQKIMHPGVTISTIQLIVNLAAGYTMVVGFGGVGGYGFHACPIVTACVEWLGVLVLLGYYCGVQGLHKDCWPEEGFSSKYITRSRMWKYFKVYFPAALSVASDFWRVAVIGAVASSMSEDQLAVFNSSYRILWICLTFVGSTAAAVGIKLSSALGAGQPRVAENVVRVGSTSVVLVLLLLGIMVYAIPHQLGSIFSSDPVVLALFVQIRIPLATMMIFMNLAVFLESVINMTGKTALAFKLGLVGSWVGQVPGVLLCTHFWRRDLVGLYTGVSLGYALLSALLLYYIAQADWKQHVLEAQERSEVSKEGKEGEGEGEVGGEREDVLEQANDDEEDT